LVNTPCTANTRFTVGQSAAPGRLIPHNVDKVDNPPRTNVPLPEYQECEKPRSGPL